MSGLMATAMVIVLAAFVLAALNHLNVLAATLAIVLIVIGLVANWRDRNDTTEDDDGDGYC